MDEQEPQKWRDALKKILREPGERQRLAAELGINPATLGRWASGESKPRGLNWRQLLAVLPEENSEEEDLLPEVLPEAAINVPDSAECAEEIPSIFYARVLNAHCSLPKLIHFSSLCDVILLQALKQLDPKRRGMELTAVQCMYSPDGCVHSLRESIGRGTPPWTRELEQKTMFLGMESLAGFVVSHGRSRAIHNRQEGMDFFPVQWVEWEQSAMGYPIMRSDSVAGCLMVSSTQPDCFRSLARQKLIQYYAELLSVIFEANTFYPLHSMDLGYMPGSDQQRPYIETYRQRAANLMVESNMNLLEAQQRAWQEIERELLLRPSLGD